MTQADQILECLPATVPQIAAMLGLPNRQVQARMYEMARNGVAVKGGTVPHRGKGRKPHLWTRAGKPTAPPCKKYRGTPAGTIKVGRGWRWFSDYAEFA